MSAYDIRVSKDLSQQKIKKFFCQNFSVSNNEIHVTNEITGKEDEKIMLLIVIRKCAGEFPTILEINGAGPGSMRVGFSEAIKNAW